MLHKPPNVQIGCRAQITRFRLFDGEKGCTSPRGSIRELESLTTPSTSHPTNKSLGQAPLNRPFKEMDTNVNATNGPMTKTASEAYDNKASGN